MLQARLGCTGSQLLHCKPWLGCWWQGLLLLFSAMKWQRHLCCNRLYWHSLCPFSGQHIKQCTLPLLLLEHILGLSDSEEHSLRPRVSNNCQRLIHTLIAAVHVGPLFVIFLP